MRLLLAILALVLLAASAAHAEKRAALVIGNADYKNALTLQNPKNDATDVADALKRPGFETIVGLDLDKNGMEEKTIEFARAAHDADVALVYYSGHAMQFGGFNYLIPVDAALHDEADLRRLIRVDEIVSDLVKAKNLHRRWQSSPSETTTTRSSFGSTQRRSTCEPNRRRSWTASVVSSAVPLSS